MAAQPTFHLCPPADCSHGFCYPQVLSRKMLPVHKPEENEDGTFARGLAFEDYSRCQTFKHLGGAGERRLPTPEWALNDKSLRRVVLSYMEARAINSRHWSESMRRRKLSERTRALLILRHMTKLSTGLIERYVHVEKEYMDHLRCSAAWCVARRKELRIILSGIDRQICLTRRPDFIYVLVTRYYRSRIDSVGVAAECGMSPGGVRQILHRINLHAQSLGYPAPPPDTRWANARQRRQSKAASQSITQ
jgi:hypothetical protein